MLNATQPFCASAAGVQIIAIIANKAVNITTRAGLVKPNDLI
jgi:hypothetical protein